MAWCEKCGKDTTDVQDVDFIKRIRYSAEHGTVNITKETRQLCYPCLKAESDAYVQGV